MKNKYITVRIRNNNRNENYVIIFIIKCVFKKKKKYDVADALCENSIKYRKQMYERKVHFVNFKTL